MQSPEQRAVFDQLMALMTLLEGHADHVMDAVGPAVVPSVAAIRTSFTQRRQRTKGPIDRLLRALLGMDMKLAQYVKGGAFVGAVVEQVGMDGFNAVWTSPRDAAHPGGDHRPAGLGAPGARLSMEPRGLAVRRYSPAVSGRGWPSTRRRRRSDRRGLLRRGGLAGPRRRPSTWPPTARSAAGWSAATVGSRPAGRVPPSAPQ